MVIIKALLAGLICVSFCMALSISGTVTDTGGIPIQGATVYLEQNKDSAMSDSYGHFTLGVTGVKNQISQSTIKPSAVIQNGFLFVNLQKKAAVEISMYNLQGKAISTIQKTMNAGNQSIALPQIGAGVYLYKVKSGSSEYLLKSNMAGNVSQGSVVNEKSTTAHNALAKQAKVMSAISDVIASTKAGYLDYRCVQYNSDTSGLQIKMIVCADTVRDADGNLYHAVRIGGQVWTVENLRTTKYNDKSAISLDTSTTTWASVAASKYCYYNNTTNADSINKFGALYNWYTVNTGKLAPAGWHVPSDSEWTIMKTYLVLHGYNWDRTTDTTSMSNKIAIALASKTDWNSDTITGTIGKNLTQNNRSGFSALPGGYRYYNGHFYLQGSNGYWWSATESDASNGKYRYLSFGLDYLAMNGLNKTCGFSVRLLRDSGTAGCSVVPYVSDANTVLLEHFDGTSIASFNAFIVGSGCGTQFTATTPSYSYGAGQSGLGQCLMISPPAGQPVGSSTYLKYPTQDILCMANGTVEFWVYPTTYGLSFADQGQWYNSCGGWTFRMGTDATGHLTANDWDVSGSFPMTASQVVPLNTWSHVAVTWGSTGAKLYLNGVLVASNADTDHPASGYGGYLMMCCGSNTSGVCRIDELRVSNVQRTIFNLCTH